MTPAPHGSGPEANLRHTGAQMTKNVYSFNSIRSKEKDLFLLFHPSSAIILFLSTLIHSFSWVLSVTYLCTLSSHVTLQDLSCCII